LGENTSLAHKNDDSGDSDSASDGDVMGAYAGDIVNCVLFLYYIFFLILRWFVNYYFLNRKSMKKMRRHWLTS